MVTTPRRFQGLGSHLRLLCLGAEYVNLVAAPLHGDLNFFLAFDDRWSLRSAWQPTLQRIDFGRHLTDTLAALKHYGTNDS